MSTKEDDIRGSLGDRVRSAPIDALGTTPEDAPVEEDYAAFEAAATRIEHESDIVPGGPVGGADPGRLVIIGGNNRGQEFMLHAGDNSIGRALENDVVLADIAVSRKHTLVCSEGDQFIVRDLGSGNGTVVNGQRVTSHLLVDGDQIELGKTLLRFHGAAQAIPQIPAPLPARAPAYAPPPMLDAGETDGRIVGRGISSRAKWLLIYGGIGLVVLLGSLIGVKQYLKSRKQERRDAQAAQLSADEIAAQHFEEGTKEYRARNWKAARTHYLKVLAVAPSFEQARRYADQAAAELTAQEALKRAKSGLEVKDFTAARRDLAQVPSTSTYAAEARTLKRELDAQQVKQLLESARLLEASADREGAKAKVAEAMKISPTNEAVREAHERLNAAAKPTHPSPSRRPVAKGTPRRPRPVHPPALPRERPTPSIRVSANTKPALALYRKKQWGPAYQALKDLAAGQKGRRQENLDALAAAIHKVGQSLNRAVGVQSKDPAKALTYYETALKADKKVPGAPHQAFIKEQQNKVARFMATSAMARGQYAQAYKAIALLRQRGRLDGTTKGILAQLEKKASELFTKGYTIRSSNPAKARKMWQDVLRMVPPTSSAYQKAYSWLNQSAPTYRDEDED